MLDPNVLYQVSLACKTQRLKKELKRGKPFCGHTVKEIIQSAGRRQLSQPDEIPESEDEENKQDLVEHPVLRARPNRSIKRLSLDRRASVENFLLSQENLLDFNNGSANAGTPLASSRRHRRNNNMSLSSVNLLENQGKNNSKRDKNDVSRSGIFTSLIGSPNPGIFPIIEEETTPLKLGEQPFDLSNLQNNFNAENNDHDDDNGPLLLGAMHGLDMSSTEIQFNLGKLNENDENEEIRGNYPFMLDPIPEECSKSIDGNMEISEIDVNGDLLQSRLLERGTFSDDSEDEGKIQRKPILSRYMMEVDDHDEEREQARMIHYEKFIKESIERETKFGKTIYSPTKESSTSYTRSRSRTFLPSSPKSSRYSSKFLADDDEEDLGTKPKRIRRHRHDASDSSEYRNHKFLYE